jgi:hypothetical protein
MATWLFYLGNNNVEMKHTKHTLSLSRFPHIFFSIYILFISSPSLADSSLAENKTYSVKQPAKVTSSEEAVNISRKYLKIEYPLNYKIKIQEEVITANAFNSYKTLVPGTNRLCWVVTFIVTDAVGAGRTVYVDKESGEILGGYSSK